MNKIIKDNTQGLPVATFILICVISAILGGFSCNYLVAIYPLAFIVISAAGTAFLVCYGNNYFLPFLSVPAALVIAYFVSGRVEVALFSLAYAICAIPLILFSKGKIKMLTGIISIAAVLALHIALFAYIDIKSMYPDRSALGVVFETANAFIDQIANSFAIEGDYQDFGQQLSEVARQAVMVVPGVLFAIFEGAGLLMTLLFGFLAKTFSKEEKVIRKDNVITVSVVSSVVFLLLGLLSFFGFNEVVWYASQNLFIVMLPGFAWCGIRDYIKILKRINRPVVMIVSLVFLAFSGPASALTFMGVLGATTTILRYIRSRKKNDQTKEN